MMPIPESALSYLPVADKSVHSNHTTPATDGLFTADFKNSAVYCACFSEVPVGIIVIPKVPLSCGAKWYSPIRIGRSKLPLGSFKSDIL